MPALPVTTASLIASAPNDVHSDFDGDGRSEILVMNTGMGVLSYGDVTAGGITWNFIGGLASGWQVLSTGDFSTAGGGLSDYGASFGVHAGGSASNGAIIPTANMGSSTVLDSSGNPIRTGRAICAGDP